MMKLFRAIIFLLIFLPLPACSGEQPTDVATGQAPPPTADSIVAELNLSGRLYFIGASNEKQTLYSLDMATGERRVVFDPPPKSWLSNVAASPDGRQLLLAYSPPPEGNQIQFGFTDLYTMPADGSAAPALLIGRTDPSETFFNISWPAPDLILYAHYAMSVDETGLITYAFQIERLPYPGRQPEVLVTNAAWPRLSKDGARLVYVTDKNEFVLAAADGSNPELLLQPDLFAAVDAPLFSPDGASIIFSAVEPDTPLSWWDRLLGVRVASAHAVPSDWYVMPAAGGAEPERLTRLNAIGLYGAFSPDGSHLAFISSEGVYLMNPDGSDLHQIMEIPTTGNLDWAPQQPGG